MRPALPMKTSLRHLEGQLKRSVPEDWRCIVCLCSAQGTAGVHATSGLKSMVSN